MTNIYSQSGQVSYGIKIYIADTENDKNSLPTKDKMGTKIYVIESKKWYILNGNGAWVPFVPEDGSADAILLTIEDMTAEQKEQFRYKLGISNIFAFQGTISTESSLPTTGNKIGNVYYVSDTSSEYVWVVNESHQNGYWEKLEDNFGGGSVTPESIVNASGQMT